MSKFQTSLQEGQHKQLSKLAGNWKGTTRTWFEPGQLADESPMEGTIKPIFGGRFMLHEYKGMLQGKPFEGMAIYGYNIVKGCWESAWVDTFHMGTGILFSESKPETEDMNLMAYYATGYPESPTWGWRTTIEMDGDDKLILTAYNVTPEGEEAKGTETIYTRM